MKKPIDVKLTAEGLEKFKKERQELLERRPGVVVRMATAREQGDLSENAGYHAAKEELSKIDSRLRELVLLIRFADVVGAKDAESVSFGSHVIVENGGEKQTFEIVSKLEADPSKGKISDVSPFGAALLGKTVGDLVQIDVPQGKIQFKIVEIKVS